MPKQSPSIASRNSLKVSKFRILYKNWKLIIHFLVTSIFICLAIWFINKEKAELIKVKEVFIGANTFWILIALCLIILYIIILGLMYVSSFAAVNTRIKLLDAIVLFLKRNLAAVFLPAGGVSSLIFFSSEIEKKGVTKTQVYFASSVYAFVGILSVIIVALPAFLFAVTSKGLVTGKWLALIGVIIILLTLYAIFNSLIRKRTLYRLLIKVLPKAKVFIEDLINNKINRRYFIRTVIISVTIDLMGIGFVYISMLALHLTPSLSAAILAYITAVLFLIISPFLRGLGAIEVSMTYVLMHSGYNNVDSIAITLLFRFFEFWLPFLTGLLTFLLKIEKLLRRILPAALIFTLGIVNIISVLTPALPERLTLLRDYLLADIVNFSNSFVLLIGLFLLVTAVFMLKGLRMAWWFAMMLSIISILGHLTKGIDYEEAIIALIIVGSLITTRKEYYVKSNPRLRTIGFQTALLSIAAVLVYGTIGFYFLDKKHFQIDFSFVQSFLYTLQNYFLIGSQDLVPRDVFAMLFINSIKISGFASLAFLVYTFVRPYVFKLTPSLEEIAKAKSMIELFGCSALDYFKTYSDKLLFFPSGINAFIAYHISRNFAVVLENPVAESSEEMEYCIIAFSRYCYENGIKEIFYRVPKESLHIYTNLGKKNLFLGQEGIIDLATFTLEGGDKKSIRNAINKITEQGYTSHVHFPPLKDGVIQKLKSVSDDWLKLTKRYEIIFSQGMFVEKEIKQQTVITVENNEEKVIAFLNIIPDHVKNESTFDLLRKTADAPNGIMDYILIELFKYLKSQGIQFVNLGFAPLSGLNDPLNFTEKSMKFAYEKIRSFSHYKGQREYKEKFNPRWNDKYLIYDHDYDLLRIPVILAEVIQP